MVTKAAPYDVAVAGGGPAGATLARLLAAWGLRVVVCEAAHRPSSKPGEVLAPSAQPVLRTAGLACSELIASGIAVPYRGIRSIWGSDGEVVRGDSELGGVIIDRPRLEAHLAALAIRAGVEWRWHRRVHSAVRDGGAWRIETRVADTAAVDLRARVIIDATGRRGALAQRLGARRRLHDRLIAFGLERRSCRDRAVRDDWLRIEAAEHGWWYGVDTPDGSRRTVCITDASGRLRGPRDLLGRTVAIGEWFDGMGGPLTPLATVDASSACLDAAAGPGWAAIGDAATSFDPITAQGLPQAFATGVTAAAAIRSEFGGQAGALEAYAAAAITTWLDSTVRRAGVYATELRWSATPFWRRRLPRATAAPSSSTRWGTPSRCATIATVDEARAAKTKVLRLMDRVPGVQGVGITRVGEG